MDAPAPLLSDPDHARVSAAVAAAEARTAGEIVTIVTESSDGYTDVALAWAALAAFTALTALSLMPGAALALLERVSGGWGSEWTLRGLLALASAIGIIAFLIMLAVQMWPALRFRMLPGPVRSARVRERAVEYFKVGAERRMSGRTGILIYLSMREHRAEIVADEAIAGKVAPEVWGEAMAAMLSELRQGRVADGIIAAVDRVGEVLAGHFPQASTDRNELPDRLIEL